MDVTVVSPTLATATVGRYQRLAGDCQVRVFVQEQSPAQPDAVASVMPDGQSAQAVRLYVFCYVDGPYPLLKAICAVTAGLVVLDLCAATTLRDAPVHYADLCLVRDAVQQCDLHQRFGYPLERVCVLPQSEGNEAALNVAVQKAMQGRAQQPPEGEVGMEPERGGREESHRGPVVRVRDPLVDERAIQERVQRGAQARAGMQECEQLAATLGPEELRTSERPATDAQADDLALRYLQMALDDLAGRARLREPGFASDVPLVGPLIVGVRRLWNWMSAKWYVRAWMAQQADLNSRLVGMLGQLLQVQHENERRLREIELYLQHIRAEQEHTE